MSPYLHHKPRPEHAQALQEAFGLSGPVDRRRGEHVTVPPAWRLWHMRLISDAHTGMPLGFIGELWKPVDAWSGIDGIISRVKASGRDVDDYRLRDATSQRLLWEVVNAAQAVMYTVEKIVALIAEVEAWADESVPRLGPDDDKPAYGTQLGDPRIVMAGWEFVNLLAWLRNLEERIERGAFRGNGKVGLLPMLNPKHPIAPNVRRRFEQLRSGALGERRLANLVLHHETVPRPHTGAELSDDHRVVVRIPDRLDEAVDLPFELTYEEERDLLSLAVGVAADVESFVDGLLGEFEEANRMRVRGEMPPD